MQDRWQTVQWRAAITQLATQGLDVCFVFGKTRRDFFLEDGVTPEEYDDLVDRLKRCDNVPPNGMMDDAQRILGGKLQQALDAASVTAFAAIKTTASAGAGCPVRRP